MARRRRRRSRTLRGRLLRFLFRVVLLGLALAIGVTALAVFALRAFPPPTTAFMVLSRFADPATGLPCDRVEQVWVDWERIAPAMALAVVVAEDQRFFQHDGFDLDSIGKAVGERLTTGRMRGASTISQQLAKNLFLWPGQNLLRKGLEVWFTVWLERTWTKRRILETYLNVAQFGPCNFGVEAAARRFFHGDAASLEPEQAALLASVLPNPKRLRAHNPGPYIQERTAEILELMQLPDGPPYLRGRL